MKLFFGIWAWTVIMFIAGVWFGAGLERDRDGH